MNLDPYRGDQGDMGDGVTEGRGTIGGVRVSKKFFEGGMGVMQQKVLADLKNHKCLCNNPHIGS